MREISAVASQKNLCRPVTMFKNTLTSVAEKLKLAHPYEKSPAPD